MQIKINPYLNFKRRLKASEEAEYRDTLSRGKNLISNSTNGKFILIMHSASMPQTSSLNTGVGYLGNKKSIDFCYFAKKYWGITDIQLLPTGQFFIIDGNCPIYSGSSMDLGNHMINIERYLSKEDIRKIAKNVNSNSKIIYDNVIKPDSLQESALKKLHKSMPNKLKEQFEEYKIKNGKRLEAKSVYEALKEIYGNKDIYWSDLDKNLYNKTIVSIEDRNKRISEIKKLKSETIDFYLFKQFLADDSLKDAREKLNKIGFKIHGDMISGFSRDEVWANPDAFIKDATIGWGLPALKFNSPEAEKLLREKVHFYATHFDGFRIDASWTYSFSHVYDKSTKRLLFETDYHDKILKIIDDEIKKVRGEGYDLKNIMHEFAADYRDFDMYKNGKLKSYVAQRVKIQTSDYLSDDYGSNYAFSKRGWNNDYFILGATNHDSKEICVNDEQAKVLSSILKIDKNKLADLKEFIKAKFAEPMAVKNTMIMFTNALGINKSFGANKNFSDNYKIKIPENFEEFYHKALQSGEGFNPMDALEKQFIAQGLDKKEKALFEKIVKFRKILEQKESKNFNGIISTLAAIAFFTAVILHFHKTNNKQTLPEN